MLQRLIKNFFFVLHMCFLPSELILVFQTYKCLLSPFKTTACYASCAAILDTSTYVPLPLFFHQIMNFSRGEKSTFSHTKPCYFVNHCPSIRVIWSKILKICTYRIRTVLVFHILIIDFGIILLCLSNITPDIFFKYYFQLKSKHV